MPGRYDGMQEGGKRHSDKTEEETVFSDSSNTTHLFPKIIVARPALTFAASSFDAFCLAAFASTRFFVERSQLILGVAGVGLSIGFPLLLSDISRRLHTRIC